MSAVLRGAGRRNLLTVEEFCAAMDLKPNTVHKWLRAGKLRGRKVGSRWRIFASELRKAERR